MVETAKLEIRALKNDTVEKLAKRYNTTESEILAENPNLKDGEKIATGTKITLPVSVFDKDGTSTIKYNVRKGDCLSMTAWQLNDGTPIYGANGKVRQIANMNNISNPNLIYTDQEFDVPVNADRFVKTTEPEVVDEEDEAGEVVETEEKPEAGDVEEAEEVEEPKATDKTTEEESEDEGSSIWGWVLGGAAIIGAGILAYKYRGQIADFGEKAINWCKNLFGGNGKAAVEGTEKIVEETGKVVEETGKIVEETGKVVEEAGTTVKEISKDAEALLHPNGYSVEELGRALEEVEAANKLKSAESLLHPNGYTVEELDKALEEVEAAAKAKEAATAAQKATKVESYAAGELDEFAAEAAQKAEKATEIASKKVYVKPGINVKQYANLNMSYKDVTSTILKYETMIKDGKNLSGFAKAEYIAALRMAADTEKSMGLSDVLINSRLDKIRELTSGKCFAA